MGYREQNLTLPILSAHCNIHLIFILLFFHSSLPKPLFCEQEAYEKSKLCLIAREPRISFLDFPFLSLPVKVPPIYSSLECDATSRQLLQFSGFKSAILALPSTPIAQSAALGGQIWLLPGGTAQAKLDLLQKSLLIFLSWH